MKEAQADQPISPEVAALPNVMMNHAPILWADRAKKVLPQWEQPSAGIVCRHEDRGLKHDDEDGNGRWSPVPKNEKTGMTHAIDYRWDTAPRAQVQCGADWENSACCVGVDVEL